MGAGLEVALMVSAGLPPLGRCQLCRMRKHVSPHRSRRDGLRRLLCTRCFSDVTLAEERGGVVDFDQAAVREGPGEDLLTWLRGDL
ncbi:hypothetical protein HTV80_12995 [Streptomyces sp. Vc74B-19]|uniref:hypothetical protein n=1 Tax=Streptomyces sp. Vc74B-19 TaxID=2741324 RepID=UPI001BFC32E2|nr:hypothetical protein [Streptomyces sp. Vc74B-19]MBT3164027.1 hypothetical protein [Streptomyces sp. Vc74B-19]